MRKKHRKHSSERASGNFDNLATPSDFYTSVSPTEKPLYQDRPSSEHHRIRKTARHQQVGGRRQEKIDERDKKALVAILRSTVVILLLLIAFFMLYKGVNIYEENIWMKNQATQEISPVMREVVVVEDFDIENQEQREQFAERIEVWKQAQLKVRSADAMQHRGNYDQAIERCLSALELDPLHMAAWDRLGQLYFSKGDYVKSVNAYTRLLSVDPSRLDVQKRLIQALDAFGDFSAVRYMAEWYLDENNYDAEVQRHLANSMFAEEAYEEAVVAYERVLQDDDQDIQALERLAQVYMQLGEYEKALPPLTTLRSNNYREPSYYRQLAICQAQLKQGTETVKVYGRAAQLFSQQLVMGWMQDPLIDPVRDDRTFQSFADRIGGEEFRLWLEKMAQASEGAEPGANLGGMLELPTSSPTALDSELLKPRQ